MWTRLLRGVGAPRACTTSPARACRWMSSKKRPPKMGQKHRPDTKAAQSEVNELFARRRKQMEATRAKMEQDPGYQERQRKQEEEQRRKERKQRIKTNAAKVGWCVFGSVWVGAILTTAAGNEAHVILDTWDETTELMFDPDEEVAENVLKLLARTLWKNDAAKVKMCDLRLVNRLLHFLSMPSIYPSSSSSSPYSSSSVMQELPEVPYPSDVQTAAIEIIQVMLQHPDSHKWAVEHQLHRVLIHLLTAPGVLLMVQKNAALALANLAGSEDKNVVVALGKAGAVPGLRTVLRNKHLFRHRVKRAVMDVSSACVADVQASGGVPSSYDSSDWVLMQLYEDERAALASDTWSTLQDDVYQSGLMLYLHTIGGGAAWGLANSLWHGVGRQALIQSVYRTSLVTGFVPAYFIGGIVTVYQSVAKTLDTDIEMFRWTTATSVAVCVPWVYMLPVLDKLCPLWLGGHVVGFCSFFLFMMATDNDMFKSDHQLKIQDEQRKEWKTDLPSTFFDFDHEQGYVATPEERAPGA